jgi:hypothetical protein
MLSGVLAFWRSGVQVLGKQTRQTALQYAAHRVKRSENDDSISGVCRGDGCLQRQFGRFVSM